MQWSFRETGTIITLAIQSEIGVWVQAGVRGRGISPTENVDIVYAKYCNLASFLAGKWFAIPSLMRS